MILLVLGVAVVGAFVVARSMIRSLRRLQQTAQEVAQKRLPELVKQLSESDPQDLDTSVESIGINSRDEIGQVARAFDEVHREAVRLAAEQALLRGNVNAMFTNLSRRSQGLIQRQLSLISELETREADPDQLSKLFKLDHLATRMRRNGENLLVLAGEEPGRRWTRPVPLVDVLRAAASEVEQYERIELTSVPPTEVAGRVVNDLVHLLAELLENATSFSSPQTKVRVTGHALPDGRVLIEIHDTGIGLSPEDLADINERLANPPTVDVAVSRRMGLFVVGRLSLRHGIRIQLRPSDSGGTTALVMLPVDLTQGGANAKNAPAGAGAAAARRRRAGGSGSAGGARRRAGQQDRAARPGRRPRRSARRWPRRRTARRAGGPGRPGGGQDGPQWAAQTAAELADETPRGHEEPEARRLRRLRPAARRPRARTSSSPAGPGAGRPAPVGRAPAASRRRSRRAPAPAASAPTSSAAAPAPPRGRAAPATPADCPRAPGGPATPASSRRCATTSRPRAGRPRRPGRPRRQPARRGHRGPGLRRRAAQPGPPAPASSPAAAAGRSRRHRPVPAGATTARPRAGPGQGGPGRRPATPAPAPCPHSRAVRRHGSFPTVRDAASGPGRAPAVRPPARPGPRPGQGGGRPARQRRLPDGPVQGGPGDTGQFPPVAATASRRPRRRPRRGVPATPAVLPDAARRAAPRTPASSPRSQVPRQPGPGRPGGYRTAAPRAAGLTGLDADRPEPAAGRPGHGRRPCPARAGGPGDPGQSRSGDRPPYQAGSSGPQSSRCPRRPSRWRCRPPRPAATSRRRSSPRSSRTGSAPGRPSGCSRSTSSRRPAASRPRRRARWAAPRRPRRPAPPVPQRPRHRAAGPAGRQPAGPASRRRQPCRARRQLAGPRPTTSAGRRAEQVREPAAGGVTPSGLPRRVPRANLVAGGAQQQTPHSAARRSRARPTMCAAG